VGGKRTTNGAESVDAQRRRIEELERWFQGQDRQIRYLERERQKLSALVNHTDAGFLVLDPALSVVWLNNVCRAWFAGKSPVQLDRAASCNELLCGAPRICRDCPGAAALAKGTVSHREMRLDLDETARHIYATAMPIKSPDNHVDECILMLQDITDLEVLRRSQEALLEAKEAAESATRAKSEFLANMSHEVRTPMTGILSMSTHLLETTLTSDQRECLSIIQSCGDSLLTIINDILDFSRIEAGRLSIEPASFELVVLVEELVSLVIGKAEEKGIELIVRCAPDVPCRLIGDVVRIRQVLMNLVANAIKFTHEGTVYVNIEKLSGDGREVKLQFSVDDTGIGIPADKLGSVFDKFTQADGSITRRYGGTGLGLAISKQLVELMGGEIAVTSTPGAGSTFSFSVSLSADTEMPPMQRDYGGLRVLFVHHHEKMRAAVTEQIEAWRGHCRGVATGSEALAVLDAAQRAGAPYHLVLVEQDVSDTTPEELARSIRSVSTTTGPVLALATTRRCSVTGAPSPEEQFDLVVSRPTCRPQLDQMLATVRRAVHGPGAAAEAVETLRAPAASPRAPR
jgi:signal transduction histidine kinase